MEKFFIAQKHMMVIFSAALILLGTDCFAVPMQSALSEKVMAGSQSNVKAAEPQSFRQALSDLAWGRTPKKNPTVKPEPLSSQNVQSPEAQRIAMVTMQSRMAYCAQNWKKDPTCSYQSGVGKAKK